MTDDIFDYFSGNSTRKVEPIEDDDDELIETSNDASEADSAEDDLTMESDATVRDVVKSESEKESAAEAPEEKEETVSHWKGLLSKLGISSPTKAPMPPQSVDLPTRSDNEKAERAARRKAKDQDRFQTDQPFGGIAAPPGSKPISKQTAPNEEIEKPSKKTSRKSSAKKETGSPSKPKDKKQTPSHQFGLGILDELTPGDKSDVESEQETKMLEDLFPSSEDFVPPFEETIDVIDDVSFDDEPTTARIHKEPARFDEPGDAEPKDDDVDGDEFIEYEVQDLDFNEDAEDDRKRRPSRRDKARRNRESPSTENRESRSRSRPKRGEVDDSKARSTRGRARQDKEQVADEESNDTVADSGKSPSRRGSRGRHRGRGSRPSREIHDKVDNEENDFDESLEVDEIEDFDDRDVDRDRKPGRNRKGGSNRSRQTNRSRDEVDIDRDPRDGDGYDDEKPEPTRARRRRRRPEEDDETGDNAVKRPKIPTWSEAVSAMVETNIKSRGSKPAGQGRGRGGPRRPRRR